MRTRSVAAALLIAFTPMTFTGPAFAQGVDDPTVKAARARFNEGIEFFDKGQFENARAAFLQAYALRKHPAVLLNLAQSTLRAGHNLEAAKYFQQYLKESTGLTAAQRSDAEKGLAEARTKLARVDVSAPTGAEIFVDGEHVGTAPLTAAVDVEPGAHTVKANADSRSISVTVGQLLPVRFAAGGGAGPIVPGPSPATPEEATPSPPATNPTEESTTAATTPSTAAATSGPGLLSPPSSMAPFWVGISAAIAGTATAVLFGVFKGNANTNFENTQKEIFQAYKKSPGGTPPKGFCPSQTNPSGRFYNACQNLASDFNQVNGDATAANVGIAVAILGVAFSAGWYLLAPKGDSHDTPRTGSFAPILEPHVQGLSYGLTF